MQRTFTVVSDSPLGRQEGQLALDIDGEHFTGTLDAMGQKVPLKDGHVEGNRLTGSFSVRVLFTKVEGTFEGTIDGDTISGVVNSNFGNFSVTSV